MGFRFRVSTAGWSSSCRSTSSRRVALSRAVRPARCSSASGVNSTRYATAGSYTNFGVRFGLGLEPRGNPGQEGGAGAAAGVLRARLARREDLRRPLPERKQVALHFRHVARPRDAARVLRNRLLTRPGRHGGGLPSPGSQARSLGVIRNHSSADRRRSASATSPVFSPLPLMRRKAR